MPATTSHSSKPLRLAVCGSCKAKQWLPGDGEALVLYGLAKGDDPAHGLVLTRDDGPLTRAVLAALRNHPPM